MVIDIGNLESKISFKDGVFNPPHKIPCKYQLYNTLIVISYNPLVLLL